jgi:signal transduction histidine kinase
MSYGERLESLDSKWVFRAYAIVAAMAGFVLAGWGPAWLGTDLDGETWAKAALVRVFGAILMGVGCAAEGFARVQDPIDRRRALLWFSAGHSIVVGMLLVQQTTVWGHGLGERAGEILGIAAVLLFYSWFTADGEPVPRPLTTLFGSGRPETTVNLRSRYEQQIREAARQEERNRLARDLHDSIKQQIFVIQTAAATVQARLGEDPKGALAAAEQVRGAAREAMTEMEVMLDQLRSVPLENAGLAEALKKQCEALGFRTGARVELKLGSLPAPGDWPPGSHEAVLRVAQEALANIGRHARAQNVIVSLNAVSDQIELRVEDDGSGFDAARPSSGRGIANMRARAEEFGGTMEVITRPGGGTSIAFAFPYMAPESADECKRKLLLWTALVLMQVLLFAARPSTGILVSLAFAAFWFVRYLVAWRRALQKAEESR